MDDALSWLLLEGIPPLFGAAALYWALAASLLVVGSSNIKFQWHDAVDSTGWLYGAAVLAVQATLKGAKHFSSINVLLYCSGALGLACLLLLISAMFAKAADKSWQPKTPMKVGAAVITILVLIAGYHIQKEICCLTEVPNA
ncbi:hypothetical protein D3C84_685320 [compost metagenome]|jgi:malic enzyme